jgi:hypothetical protein
MAAQTRSSRSSPRPASNRTIGTLEAVAELNGPAVTGISVSRAGRLFVSFPRWSDPMEYSVAEIRDGKPSPFPNPDIFDEAKPASERLVCVQSVIVDARDRLWALDSGSVGQGPVLEGGPKLVAFDLETGAIVRKIVLPPQSLKTKSYLNDVRFDLERGGGWAFRTKIDAGPAWQSPDQSG